MIQISKFFRSETGVKLLSIMLGLGIAGLFKMSCDSRSCIVFKGPQFEENNKTVKVNDKCYKVTENIINCEDSTNKELVYV